MEWVWLGETLQIISFQPHCLGREHLPLNKAAHNPIPLDLEHFQGWHIHRSSGAEAPGLF